MGDLIFSAVAPDTRPARTGRGGARMDTQVVNAIGSILVSGADVHGQETASTETHKGEDGKPVTVEFSAKDNAQRTAIKAARFANAFLKANPMVREVEGKSVTLVAGTRANAAGEWWVFLTNPRQKRKGKVTPDANGGVNSIGSAPPAPPAKAPATKAPAKGK